VDRFADAYGGLLYLATLPFVAPDRVGLVGMGNGGRLALTIADADQAIEMVSNPKKLRFKAAVAYYPGCSTAAAKLSFPTLIMIGREDQVYRAQGCEELKARLAPDSAPAEFTLYPGVHHGFLEPEMGTGVALYGISRGEYDAKAADDSLRRAREFLARSLGGGAR
jgi:dienelactone hydrolase